MAQGSAQGPPKGLCPSVTSVASVCPAQAAASSPTHSVSTVTVRVTTGSPPFSPAGYSVTSTISVTMVSVTSVTSVTSRVVTGFQDQVLRGTLARGGVQAAPPTCPLSEAAAAPPFCTATSDWLRLSTGLPGRLPTAPGTGLQPFSTGTGAFSSGSGQASVTPPADGCSASSPGSRRSSSGRRLFSPRQLGRLTEFPMARAPGPRLKSRPAMSQGISVTGAAAGPQGLRSRPPLRCWAKGCQEPGHWHREMGHGLSPGPGGGRGPQGTPGSARGVCPLGSGDSSSTGHWGEADAPARHRLVPLD